MARLFSDESSEYLRVTSAVVSAAPLTIVAWTYLDEVTASGQYTALSIADASSTEDWFTLLWRVSSGGSPYYVYAQARDAVVSQSASYPTAVSPLNTWNHIGAVFHSNISRYSFLNGDSSAQNTTDITPANLDITDIGRIGDQSPSNYFSGRLAEVGIWNVALTDAEVAVLALGISPLLVRPASLVAYWPLIRTDRDRVGGHDLTAVNTPTWADHAPDIRSPWLTRHGIFVPAAAVVGNPWYAYAQQ